MGRHSRPLLWLLLSAVIGLSFVNAETMEQPKVLVKNLANQQLQTIPPRDDNSTVSTLILTGNLISLNESDRLALGSYSGLTQLRLDNNKVTDIGAKYFAALTSLKVLSLSGNKLNRLDAETFSGLDDLTELDLSNNLLTSLPSQLLQALQNLKLLSIQGNPWNCSCELLHGFKEAQEKNLNFAAPNATCASPQCMLGNELTQAITKCYSAPTTLPTSPPQNSTVLKPALTAQRNRTYTIEQPAAQGNSWKFTMSVAVLGLATTVLIVGAIKGPSWYKLFHNYRHRRLRDHSGAEGPSAFQQTPRHQQTFTFEREGRKRTNDEEEEEDEDGYSEDPYIRREE